MYTKILSAVYVPARCKCSLSKNHIKVRFAPSPTGQLHLGGLRTALYNYLFARANNGSFVVRLEDTDQARLVPGVMESLYNDLVWSGIIPDEDYVRGGPCGPYLQSKRMDIYKEQVRKLLENETAYYCFCSAERLDLLRREALKAGQVPRYDNRCQELSSSEVKERLSQRKAHCIRFKLEPTLEPFRDLIYGDVTHNVIQTEGDPVIMKTDGYPTYHFANVVDDHLMGITHVLRGVEWQVSTPKHLLLYKAFGWTPPVFGHLPLLLNTDGSKLSKRKADITVESYRKQGILPLALINYVILVGGGFDVGNDSNSTKYIDSYEQLIKQFNLSSIKLSSGKLSPEILLDFNRLELTKLIDNKKNRKFLIERVRHLVTEALPDRTIGGGIQIDEDHITSVLNWARNRMQTLNDLVKPDFLFLWTIPNNAQHRPLQPNIIEALKTLSERFAELNSSEFTCKQLTIRLRKVSTDSGISYPELMQTMRHVLCGLKVGPPVGEILEILGKDVALQRINKCLMIDSSANQLSKNQ